MNEQKVKEKLNKIGLKDKEIEVYLYLVSNGTGSIREIASETGINRGSVHEAIKTLRSEGLVSFLEKEAKRSFVADDPKSLTELLNRRKAELEKDIEEIEDIVPQIRSIYSLASNKPVVKYFEDDSGCRKILEDILETVGESKKREYYAYSPSDPFIYEHFKDFSDERAKLDIFVKAISYKQSGHTYGKDKRKMLPKLQDIPVYTFIYEGKVAVISNTENGKFGVIIEDENLYKTQKIVFESLWETLPVIK